MFKVISPNCSDKNELFSMLNDEDIKETNIDSFDNLFKFFDSMTDEKIHLVIKNNHAFSVQGTYKKLTGWGRYIRLNFQQADQGKFGVEIQAQSIRCLTSEEFKFHLRYVVSAM